ncbi:unnamed protein product [Meloidogyne enterolobii]|uniref:Uncharacterized protein n=1 Tax=Meloidogyne enterolobii TaxID=390850 RepID=A0ACB0YPC1_MELEN
MDFIDLVESSPEPYDDHRTSAFQMEGSRTVKPERGGIRWGTNSNLNDQSSLTVPGGFGFARSRSRIDDYTDSFGRVESTQFFNRSTNGTRFFENRLSEGGGRENRGVFERGRKLVSERGEGYENQDVGGGFFSSGLNLQLLHRSARHADNNDLSQQSATIESSLKRQSLPIIYGTRKRQFFDDPPVTIKRTVGNNSLQTNESHMSLAAKQPRFSFVSFLAFEMRQETNFINSLDDPINVNLNHSKRLLNAEVSRLEESYNTEWLELDNKRIKICRYVLVPTYRYPKEIELLTSGDPRYAHFAGPLHVRVDVYSVPHIAHMRMAAVLNLLHKAFIPVI